MKRSIPLSLLLSPSDHLDLYAFIKCHSVYRHPIFYNFTYRKLSNLTGIGISGLHVRIRSMIDKGWCHISKAGHLVFKGLDKLGNQMVLIPVRGNKRDQILEFRNAIIRQNISQQIKQISKKRETVKKAKGNRPLSKREILLLRRNPKLESEIQETTLSNKRIGSLVDRSKTTGYRLQKQLRESLMIKTKARFELIKENVSMLEYNYLYIGTRHIYNYATKKLFKRHSNAIVCIQN